MLIIAAASAAIASVVTWDPDKPTKAVLFGIAAVAFALAHAMRRAGRQ